MCRCTVKLQTSQIELSNKKNNIMKKIILAIFASLFVFPVNGQINSDILGLQVGKSTKANLLKVIQDNNFEYQIDEELNQINIIGDFKWEGIHMENASFSLYHDTIWMGMFIKTFDNNHLDTTTLNNLKLKYESLSEPNTTDMLISSVFAITLGIDPKDFWIKQDGELSIIATESPEFIMGGLYNFKIGMNAVLEIASKKNTATDIPKEDVYKTALGLEVGITTWDEAIDILTTLHNNDSIENFTPEKETETISFDGYFTILDRPVGKGFLVFMNDTLLSFFGLGPTIPEIDEQYMEMIESKCSTFIDASDEWIYKSYLSNFDNNCKDKFVKKNDEIAVFAFNDTQKFIVGYFAYPMLLLKQGSSADYDEKNSVTSVAGCQFGTEATAAKDFFDRKFGNAYNSDNYTAHYMDINFIGQIFSSATIYFKYNAQSKKNEFCAIDFQKYYSTREYDAAKAKFDALRSIFSNKYTNERYIEHEGSKDLTCYYGMLNLDYSDTALPIRLTLEKSYSKGGELYYYVTISYYILNTINQYDDEI